jgi:hypothetical protein
MHGALARMRAAVVYDEADNGLGTPPHS